MWRASDFHQEWDLKAAESSTYRFPVISPDDSLLLTARNQPSSALIVWNIAEQRLVHEIVIPSLDASGGIAGIECMGAGSEVAVRSSQGAVLFIDINEPKFLSYLPGVFVSLFFNLMQIIKFYE